MYYELTKGGRQGRIGKRASKERTEQEPRRARGTGHEIEAHEAEE
jgi:hypothetical protein